MIKNYNIHYDGTSGSRRAWYLEEIITEFRRRNEETCMNFIADIVKSNMLKLQGNNI